MVHHCSGRNFSLAWSQHLVLFLWLTWWLSLLWCSHMLEGDAKFVPLQPETFVMCRQVGTETFRSKGMVQTALKSHEVRQVRKVRNARTPLMNKK